MMNLIAFSFSLLFKLPIILFVLFIASFFYFKNCRCERERVIAFAKDLNVIGHRGSPKIQPENTFVSLEHARLVGVDAVEFDVTLTKDNVLVLLHDETLDRTTNFSGPISNYTLADLKQCDFGAKFHVVRSAPAGITSVCTVEEVVIWAMEHKIKLIFDVKNTKLRMAEEMSRLFRVHNLYDLAVVSSLYPKIIYLIKRQNPRILVSLAWSRWTYSYLDMQGHLPSYPNSPLKQALTECLDVVILWCATTWLPYFLAADIVLAERAFISEAYVRDHEAAGRCVITWTINDTIESRWVNMVLRIPMITDHPNRVLTAIGSTATEVVAAGVG